MLRDVWLPRRAFSYACIVGLLVVLTVRVPSLSVFLSPPPVPDARSAAATALSSVRIVPQRVRVLGYDRARFGAGWAMTISEDGEYMDTRDLVIARSVPGPDEYSGDGLVASDIEIDHVVPLAAAWDMGAWAWDGALRRRFANDAERNLVATASEINRDKSDQTLAEWMPPDDSRHCAYAARFLEVCAEYRLAVAEDDATIVQRVCRL